MTCAEPVIRSGDPLLTTMRLTPDASVRMTNRDKRWDRRIADKSERQRSGGARFDRRRSRGWPRSEAVPVLTSTNVVCQPSPPEARCAMLPPPVPTFASAGMVVSALLGGVKRSPRTLIWPPAGVSNSMVPRLFAVIGNPRTESDKTKDVWPLPPSEMVVPARADDVARVVANDHRDHGVLRRDVFYRHCPAPGRWYCRRPAGRNSHCVSPSARRLPGWSEF